MPEQTEQGAHELKVHSMFSFHCFMIDNCMSIRIAWMEDFVGKTLHLMQVVSLVEPFYFNSQNGALQVL